MKARGEYAKASPKEQVAAAMNLSGKKTRAGRISGECCTATTKEENRNGKLSGSRTEISLNRGNLCPFFMALESMTYSTGELLEKVFHSLNFNA